MGSTQGTFCLTCGQHRHTDAAECLTSQKLLYNCLLDNRDAVKVLKFVYLCIT